MNDGLRKNEGVTIMKEGREIRDGRERWKMRDERETRKGEREA